MITLPANIWVHTVYKLHSEIVADASVNILWTEDMLIKAKLLFCIKQVSPSENDAFSISYLLEKKIFPHAGYPKRRKLKESFHNEVRKLWKIVTFSLQQS